MNSITGVKSHTDDGSYQEQSDEKAYDFYLQSFEPNVYRAPENTKGKMNYIKMEDMHDIKDLDKHLYLHDMTYMDNIDFINPQGLRDGSHAFPPTEFPQNTPSLGPNRSSQVQNQVQSQNQNQNQNLSGIQGLHSHTTMFQSPILPSQDQKSYNQEHLLQKQKQRSRQKTTPLVSPAVTPLDVHNSYSGQMYASNLHEFEPLTSPALKAQQGNQVQNFHVSSTERRRSSSTFNGDYNGGTPAKRRTPLSTPNMQATNTSKPKRSPSLRKVPQHFEPLPASSHETPNVTSGETTPMLPPQGKKMVINSNINNTSNISGGNGGGNFGPGLMSFTMNRLAEQQNPAFDSFKEGYVEPRDYREEDSGEFKDSDFKADFKGDFKRYTSSSETSPVLEAQSDEYGRRDRPAVKKTSHKLAEQGRRNRMNQAVHELSSLIPREIREKVSIPSKATTVELASTYIRQLLDELEKAKKSALKKEDES